MAGQPLEARVDLLGTNPEDRKRGFDFSKESEIQAGATIVSAVVEFAVVDQAGNVLQGPVTAPTTLAGLQVLTPAVAAGGQEVVVEMIPALAAKNLIFAFSCSATLSPAGVLVRSGRLLVTGSN